MTSKIIEAAIKVHRSLRPGLLESVYEACLTHDLRKAGLMLETQQAIPVFYDGVQLDCGFRADLIVAKTVVVEVKAISEFAPIHRAQVLTYLKLTGCPAGLLINFNVPVPSVPSVGCRYFPRCFEKNLAISSNASFVSGAFTSRM